MPGFYNNGTANSNIMFADNVDFSGSTDPTTTVTLNGQLLIGSTATPHIKVNTLTAGTGITITNGSGSITIAADGSVVGETITGDSGGALLPSSGNWNILGKSGSKTSGVGSTLTVKSPPYADASASASSIVNTGEFVTGAFTRTLPAGALNGDLVEYVCTTASQLTITASGTQEIRIGTLVSIAGGTAKSTAIGDSVSLRYRETDNLWYATSVIGTWLIA